MVKGTTLLSTAALVVGIGIPTTTQPPSSPALETNPIISPDGHYRTLAAYGESIACKASQIGLVPLADHNNPECTQIFGSASTSDRLDTIVSDPQKDTQGPDSHIFFIPNSLPASNPVSFHDTFEGKMEDLKKASPIKALKILAEIESILSIISQNSDEEKAYALQRLGGPQELYRLYDEKYHLSIEQFRKMAEGILGPSLHPNFQELSNHQICDVFRYLGSMRNLSQGRSSKRVELQKDFSIAGDPDYPSLDNQINQFDNLSILYGDHIEKTGLDCSKRQTPEPK
jgi:hypothetical protein